MKTKNIQKNLKQGFTLLELLIVVVIIGILAAIALPQYKKAVLKANLHKGISLVESLYQAQQAYILANGDFAMDIDDLDISVPIDSSCKKTQNNSTSVYKCSFGKIGFYSQSANVEYITKNEHIAYLHYLKDLSAGGLDRKAGEVWCFAKSKNDIAKKVCEEMGGQFGNSDSTWTRYKIR